MATSKVSVNGTVIIDISDATATASDVVASKTFYNAAGVKTTGNIATKTSADLTVSGATVTAPAGFYSSSASKSVATTTLPTATTTTQPTGTTILTIDRSTSTRYLSIGAGYQTGGYYTISPVANGSVTAPASISGSSATVTTGTNTLTLTKTVSVTPSVTTAGYISSGTAGNSSVSLTASVTTKAATTYNTSSSDQTIASGTYLTGTQTIKAVTTSGISAGNIKDGTTIKVGDANDDDRITAVTGTFTDAATVSTGQTAATASQILSGYSAWVDATEVKGNIATMTLPTSAAASATSGYASKATIGRSTSDQYINIPPGYNAAGGYYKVSAVANGSVTAPASISGSSATLSTGTNTLTLTKTISVTPSVTTAGYISSGTAGNSSVSLTAAVTTIGATTYNTSTSDQTISSGVYLTGAQTIRKVTTANISTGNIKDGVTIKVGDVGDDDRIAGVVGTFTDASTVSTGQTAAGASQILSGYSAWVDGSEVKGSMTTVTLPTATTTTKPSGTTLLTIDRNTSTRYLSIPAGYQTGGYYTISAVPNGSATVSGGYIDIGTHGTLTANNGSITISDSTTITPDVTAGYISSGTAGTFNMSLSAAVTTKGATTYHPSSTDQTIASGVYTTGTQTIKAVTTTNLSAGNIKSGVTVKIGDSTDDDCVTYVTGTYSGEAVVLQSKTVTPTESTQIITADTGYNALSSVEVEPISDMYVGSAVSRNTATDVIISNTQVDVPWGYYSERVVKNIPTTTLPTATTTTQPSGTTILTIDRSTSTRYLSISAGYQTGGYYTISPVANGSVTAPSSISGSSATLSTGTGTLTLTKTVSVTPNVTTAGYISSGTAGNSSVSLTASVNIRSSSDLTASGATVTAPAGYYGSAASKSVTTATLPTATTTTQPSGTTKLTIDRSTSTRYLSIPEGYQTGGYYTISAVANGSVTAPSSISGTSATLSTGTGTLTLTKTVSVTPSVTTAGYISAGTAGNSSVSLTASVNIRSSSDLTASGATITAPAGYYSAAASKSVASGTAGTPTATKGSVSNHSISVTPSVTNTTGYITGSTISGTAVSVSASELVSGTYSISANGTSIDVTNYKYVDVAVPSDATPMSDATILSICVI